MSTPEKPATPMSDAQRIRVNMREWPDEMRELCRLDFARSLESALNAAREALKPIQGWIDGSIPDRGGNITIILDKHECQKITEALAQISPQPSKTT